LIVPWINIEKLTIIAQVYCACWNN